MKYKMLRQLKVIIYILLPLIGWGWVGVSCSDSDDEDSTDEYANWQQRNEAFFNTMEDSLRSNPNAWKKIKSFTKDATSAGNVTDYIYAHVLTEGSSTVSPMYTDTVRISYRGRLIPTASYPEGYVFDQTYTGSFSWQTTSVSDASVSGFVDGFTTALLYMHIGDRWRIYIPQQLGYKTSTGGNGVIPAYSTLTFDLALIDIATSDHQLPKWNAWQPLTAEDNPVILFLP